MSFLSMNQAVKSAESADKENLVSKSNITNNNGKNSSSSAIGRNGMGRTLSRSNSALQTKSSNFIVFPKQHSRKDDPSNDTHQTNQQGSLNNNNSSNNNNDNKGKLLKYNSLNSMGSMGIGLGIGLDTLTEDTLEHDSGSNKLNIQIDNSLKKKPQVFNNHSQEGAKDSTPELPRISKSSKLLKDLQEAAIEEEDDAVADDNDLSLDMDISFGFNQNAQELEEEDDDDSIEYVPHIQDPEISYIPNNAMPLRRSTLEEVFGKVNRNFDSADLFQNEKDIDLDEEKEFLSIGSDLNKISKSNIDMGVIADKKEEEEEDDESILAVNLDFNYDDALPYEVSADREQIKPHSPKIEHKQVSVAEEHNGIMKREKRVPGYLASTAASRNKRYKPKRI